MNLVERFAEQARSAPSRVAIIEPKHGYEHSVTYGELDRCASQGARFLRELGLREGDVALVFQPMSIDLYAILIALWKVGATAQFIDPSGGRKLLDQSCSIQAPKAFIATGKAQLFRLISARIRAIPIKVAIGWSPLPARRWSAAERLEPDSFAARVGADATALCTFTSGSTGQPKGAPRSHGLLLAQHDALIHAIDLRPGEIDLATLPIFTLANLASGMTTLIPDCDLSRPGFLEADRVLSQIFRYKPTRCVASPAFLLALCQEANRRGEALPFRKLYTGGAPVFPRYLDTIQTAAPEASVSVVYGSTEAEPISHAPRPAFTTEVIEMARAGKGLLVGRPAPEAEVRIISDCFGESLLDIDPTRFEQLRRPLGEVGEIIVAGAHVLPGYLSGRGDAENKIRVGGHLWHRTGDAGYLDGDGNLWLLGRCSSKIATPDGWAYPFSVEAAASLDSRIRWSAFVELNGKRTLVVQTEPDQHSFKLEELGLPIGWVESLRFISQMPLDKRHNAKIDYPRLRALLARS